MIETKYVVGFAFDAPKMRNVALIRKKRPEWQRGKLNGIGGRIEEGELANDAMRREFQEETGQDIGDWQEFAIMRGVNNDGGAFSVVCFWNYARLCELRSITDEDVEIHSTDRRIHGAVGNLEWLIHMAIDFAKNPHPPKRAEIIY